jgi:hypothetical protein
MALLSRASGPWFILMTCDVGMNDHWQLPLPMVAHPPLEFYADLWNTHSGKPPTTTNENRSFMLIFFVANAKIQNKIKTTSR